MDGRPAVVVTNFAVRDALTAGKRESRKKEIAMPITTESFKVEGEKLLKKVKELINEGNIRKVTIKDKNGKEVMSFPLTVGVVGAVFAPILVAVGALAAVIGDCEITVEKEE